MYEPTLDTPSSADLILEADIPPFPLVSIAGSQAHSPQTYTVIPTEGSDTDWSMPLPVENPVAASNVHETSHENSASQDLSAFGVATDFLAYPPAVPTLSCRLADGLHCAQPLDGSVKSIKSHLQMHGHRHPQRQIVECPWMGCSHTLRWMNIPRHIQSAHLGIRFECFNCGKRYTRLEGLARHTASLKCDGAGAYGMLGSQST